jgi:hypothetical protein
MGTPRAYLSEGQKNIYTDYPIVSPGIAFGAQALTHAKPGLTVTLLGG